MKAKLVFMLLLVLLTISIGYSQLYNSNANVDVRIKKNQNPVYMGLTKVRTVSDSYNSTYIQLSNNQGYFKPDGRFDKAVRENEYEKTYQEDRNRIKQENINYENNNNNYKSARDKEFDRNIKSVHDFCEYVKSGGNQ